VTLLLPESDGLQNADRLIRLPVTPAHLGVRASRGHWVYPRHIQYLNEYMVDFLLDPDERFVIIELPVRHGKETRVDEPVLTPSGWSTMGALQPGDEVFGPDGRPTEVLWRSPVNRSAPKLRVAFTDGTSIDVHPAHEWTVWCRANRKWRTYETQHLARLKLTSGQGPTGRYLYQLPQRSPVEFPDAELPVDPWLIGYWIGDGGAENAYLTAGGDADEIIEILTAVGEAPHIRFAHKATGCEYLRVPTLRRRLWEIGIRGVKKIPEVCWTSSVAQRRALLQGIVDSDGHVERGSGRVRVVGHDEALVRSVATLARTLGHRATIYTETDTRPPHLIVNRDGSTQMIATAGTRWVCSWTPTDGLPPGRLARKTTARPARRQERIAIASITEAPPADGVCIQVDRSDGLFLVGRELIPTHNSWFISKYLTAWHVGCWPNKNVLLTSYSDTLAKGFSRDARMILEEYGPDLFGVKVRGDSRSVNRWEIADHFGGFKASTLYGSITGVGGDLIVIDDPVKDAKAAHSVNAREALWEWYQETLRGRLEPGGKIIVVMSRWHEDDLVGRLLAHSESDPEADQWERIRLPAIAEPGPDEPEFKMPIEVLREVGWTDEMGRQAGEALWPERWPVKRLRRIKASVSAVSWESNYQQRPTAREGDVFKTHNWKYVGALPAAVGPKRMIRRYDLADDGSDYAATSLLGWHEGRTYIIDVRRTKGGSAHVRRFFRAAAVEDRQKYGRGIEQIIEQEPGSAGKTIADQYVATVFAGFRAKKLTTSGSKELNAEGLAAQQEAGNVYLVGVGTETDGSVRPAHWWDDYKEEARTFPRGANDDMIDTSSQAYNDLAARLTQRVKGRAVTKAGASGRGGAVTKAKTVQRGATSSSKGKPVVPQIEAEVEDMPGPEEDAPEESTVMPSAPAAPRRTPLKGGTGPGQRRKPPKKRR